MASAVPVAPSRRASATDSVSACRLSAGLARARSMVVRSFSGEVRLPARPAGQATPRSCPRARCGQGSRAVRSAAAAGLRRGSPLAAPARAARSASTETSRVRSATGAPAARETCASSAGTPQAPRRDRSASRHTSGHEHAARAPPASTQYYNDQDEPAPPTPAQSIALRVTAKRDPEARRCSRDRLCMFATRTSSALDSRTSVPRNTLSL